MKKNYKVIIQFDGTAYSGWQYQAPPVNTIQYQMQKALRVIAKRKVTVTSSSRTDAGVHSRGLTANFHLPIHIDDQSLQRALNSLLPADIRVSRCSEVHHSFNARFHAIRKTYAYRICHSQFLSPFIHRYVNHIPYPLNMNRMRRAIPFFIGKHDFSAFTSDDPHRNRIREIESFTMKKQGEIITFTVKGPGFLRYMVRNMVGTVIDVGRGKIMPSDIPGIFASRDRRRAGRTAKARGLTLEEVIYDESFIPKG